MEELDLIFNSGKPAREIIGMLKKKSIVIPMWGGKKGLESEYDPKKHPVMDKSIYRDTTDEDGNLEQVTRITYDLQRLATKRMTELVCGIPVKRIYKAANDTQQEVAKWMEAIFNRNRIDSVNIERCNMLFAGCEVLTMWYAVDQKTNIYGFQSDLKFRCRNFSPMLGDELYPLFDEYGDMIAMSVGYRRKTGNKTVNYFDTYTAEKHYKWSDENGDWMLLDEPEKITLGKIPAIYVYRPTPIWEDTSRIVYEMEWAMSRNGNYLRKNSKPLFVVFADEQIGFGGEKNEKKEFKTILQYPKGSSAQYVTWQQAVENLKYYVSELRQSFFTQLQLPDWSYESMKANPMSGESRKQLFIDCQLKVKDESGRLLEFFDREVNVVKAFLKTVVDESYAKEIDALPVENEISPFTISDDKYTINQLMAANGGKALMSQRESIEFLGWTDDVDRTLEQIAEERKEEVFEPYE
jgi:hypothetical protein